MIQKLHFGEKTLDQMREKALAKWQDIEATAGRNQVRAWLDVSITYHFLKGQVGFEYLEGKSLLTRIYKF